LDKKCEGGMLDGERKIGIYNFLLLVYGEKIKKMERSMWNTRFLPRKNKT
jgi:hypothetical protein